MLPGPPAGPSKPQAEAPVSTEGPGSGHSAALRLPPIRGQAPRSDLLSSVQSLSHVRIFAIPWTAARQASLSITNSQSLLKLIPIESVMPSSHLILCCPLLLPPSIFPNIRVFSNESALSISSQNIGVSASTSVLPMNSQD